MVAIQAAVEKSLAKLAKEGKIAACAGVIHTSTSATPLSDEQAPRAEVVEEFLASGARLTILYSKAENDKAKFPEAHGERFNGLKAKYSNLTDTPHDMQAFEEKDSGATYLVEMAGENGRPGQNYVFSIRSWQIKDQKDGRTWGIYSGDPEKCPAVAQRLGERKTFLAIYSIGLVQQCEQSRQGIAKVAAEEKAKSSGERSIPQDPGHLQAAPASTRGKELAGAARDPQKGY